MDFGTLLHVARKNSESGKNSEGNYYRTKFSAPKKESKEKKLSDNIKKFLEKKDKEEREKARLEKQKRDELLAMRDEKSKNKIRKMLKVTKSANKSVLEDAIDRDNTAVTINGPEQPDEDDYGYVSQEAAALYQKYMDKVKATPEDNRLSRSRPASRTDLSGTKDRVRAAIMKEQEDLNNPQRTKAISSKPVTSSLTSNNTHRRKELYDPQVEKEMEDKKRREEEQKKVKFKKPAPPPLDFHELIKLAEKKQFEPVELVVETKKEPERLLTKKEKKEIEERRIYLQEREKRKKEQQTSGNKTQSNNRIPKLSGSTITPNTGIPSKVGLTIEKSSKSNETQKSILPSNNKDNFKKPASSVNGINKIKTAENRSKPTSSSNTLMSNSLKPKSLSSNQNSGRSCSVPNNPKLIGSSKTPVVSNTNSKPSSALPSPQKSLLQSKSNGATTTKDLSNKKLLPSQSGKTRPIPPVDVQKTRQFPPADIQRTRQFPPADAQKTRKFPPSDVQRARQFPPSDVRSSKVLKKPMPNKRRIIDDDDSEYDSELDDFIDDGPEEDQSYSSYIKEIFGYDKSRYRDYDEDDAAMESTFSQQMKEEYISKKIGLLEDLEDMKLEAEEKKRKAVKKRKLI